MYEAASFITSFRTKQAVPSKVFGFAVGHCSAHRGLPAAAIVTNALQSHQVVNAESCWIKDHKLAKASDLATELGQEATFPLFQGLPPSIGKNWLTRFDASLAVLCDRKSSKSNTTYQGIVNVSGMLDTCLVKLLVQGMQFMLWCVPLPLRIFGQVLIDLCGIFRQVSSLTKQPILGEMRVQA